MCLTAWFAPQDGGKNEDCCDFGGALFELRAHLSVCGFVEVACPNEGCALTNIRRHHLARHASDQCQHRPTACANEGCGVVLPLSRFTAHRLTCPHKLVYCPLRLLGCIDCGCTGRIARRDVEEHETSPANQLKLRDALASQVQRLKQELGEQQSSQNGLQTHLNLSTCPDAAVVEDWISKAGGVDSAEHAVIHKQLRIRNWVKGENWSTHHIAFEFAKLTQAKSKLPFVLHSTEQRLASMSGRRSDQGSDTYVQCTLEKTFEDPGIALYSSVFRSDLEMKSSALVFRFGRQAPIETEFVRGPDQKMWMSSKEFKECIARPSSRARCRRPPRSRAWRRGSSCAPWPSWTPPGPFRRRWTCATRTGRRGSSP